MIKISPSIMCANLRNLKNDIQILSDSKVDLFHFDIMDGHFVPNLALSPMIVESLRGISSVPFDIHLMVERPANFIDRFLKIGVEYITVHIETASGDMYRIYERLKESNVGLGIALNPLTNLKALIYIGKYVSKITVMTVDPGFIGQNFINSMILKVEKLKMMREEHGFNFEIEVDGHINPGNFKNVIKAGADILVLGTSGLFGLKPNLKEGILEVRKLISNILQNSSGSGINKSDLS